MIFDDFWWFLIIFYDLWWFWIKFNDSKIIKNHHQNSSEIIKNHHKSSEHSWCLNEINDGTKQLHSGTLSDRQALNQIYIRCDTQLFSPFLEKHFHSAHPQIIIFIYIRQRIKHIQNVLIFLPLFNHSVTFGLPHFSLTHP